MIVRIVRMTLRSDAIDSFLALYDSVSPSIRAQAGCRGLRLVREVGRPGVLSTISLWDTADALESYRGSELFRTTWSATRTFFETRAEAWSHEVIREDPGP